MCIKKGMKYNGLRYSVAPPDIFHSDKVPTALMKYYANNEYSQDAVMKRYLYLTHVSEFNDAYEANEYMFDLQSLDIDTYEKWFSAYLPGYPVFPYENAKEENFAMFRQLLKAVMAWIGSVSMTTRENAVNTLMWSHYATDKGFVVDFDSHKLLTNISKDDFEGFIFPINYVKELKPINPFDDRTGGMWGALLYLISTKIIDWRYEKEWRLSVYPKKGRFTVPKTLLTPEDPGIERKLYYPEGCAKTVILGEKFFNPTNVDTKAYQTSKNPLSYKLKKDLDFVTFLYEHFNDSLYMSGAWGKDNKVIRSIQQIKLRQESVDTFTIIPIR